MTPLRQRMIEDMRVRNLSANTQQPYVDRKIGVRQLFHQIPGHNRTATGLFLKMVK